MNAIVQKSADFLKAVLLREIELFDYINFFENVEGKELVELLQEEKIILWVNLYNSFVQLELRTNDSGKIYSSMFTEELFTIAGEYLSLDMIEHGILRGNRWKYGFGYIRGGQLPSKILNWMCKVNEPKIHFLLNCGAASCPVIRVLTEKNLNLELNGAEEHFIKQEVTVDKNKKKIIVPGLFLYYYADFGGKKGILNTVKRYIKTEFSRLKFQKFDWNMEAHKLK
jgi:hypothetical protein